MSCLWAGPLCLTGRQIKLVVNQISHQQINRVEVIFMDKDRVEGKVKDVAGRVERQVGEWTGDKEAQIKGVAKQVEGKVQNAWGKAKDAVKKPSTTEQDPTDKDQADTEEIERRDRAANE
jgi:uncharacterized protein YjbJ (UPF0337 family)